MWRKTRLTERLGLEFPIIQAPMAGSTTPALAAAVAAAGGLGSLGLATSSIEAARDQIAAFRRASNRGLNANFFCHPDPAPVSGAYGEMRARLQPFYAARGLGAVPEPSVPWRSFGDAHVALLGETKPEVVSFHFGLPAPEHLRAVKAAGAFVISSATTVAEARWLEAHGADAIVAQGLEAGGHRGTFLDADPGAQAGLFALLPQVVDAVGVPVVAAGGIVDGRGIAAALMLGAEAVQIGTAFLRCPEASVQPAHRAALARARDDGTRLTRLFSGRPARALANRLMDSLADMEGKTVPFPAQLSLTAPLRSGPPREDMADILSMWAGQGAPATREMAADALVRTLVAETENCLGAIAR